MRIVVACGGTGGHAFPGLAVAEVLRRRGHEVIVWDSGRAIESSVMKNWSGDIFSTGARQLRLKNALAILRSFFVCRSQLRKRPADVMLAMGSYSSLPPVLAARSRKVRVVLHEANTVPGKAVDFLSRYADRVAISFEATKRHLDHAKCVLTGLPVRANISTGTRFDFIPPDSFVLFVTGGSQGAHAVNTLVTAALIGLQRELDRRAAAGQSVRPLYVIHQTGAADEASTITSYANANIPARVHAFENEMPNAFASADFVIARAGASTCFELAQCGKSVMFIPLPSAMRNHQHFNADAFASRLAADEGFQDKLTPRQLTRYLLSIYDNPERRARMAEAIRLLATPDAAERVADLVEGKDVR